MKPDKIQTCPIVLIFFAVFLSACHTTPQHTNPSTLTDEQFKEFISQRDKMWNEYNSDSSTNSTDKLFANGQALQKDYPTEANGYQFMMCAIEDKMVAYALMMCGQTATKLILKRKSKICSLNSESSV